ncbi:MAG: hypothetical protein WCK10_01440 [Candidatus Staskawiczbacteria bacterium]
MQETEKIAREHGCRKISVISGVGVREYYSSKLGYSLDKEGVYMVKNLKNLAPTNNQKTQDLNSL